MKALYHEAVGERMSAEKETVQTVYRDSCYAVTGLKPGANEIGPQSGAEAGVNERALPQAATARAFGALYKRTGYFGWIRRMKLQMAIF
jgi:hypothetical protein